MATATDSPRQMYIDGRWQDACDGGTLSVITRPTNRPSPTSPSGGRADAELAIDAAARAFPAWKATSVYDRAKVLKKTAELMRERVDLIARALTTEQGKPLPEGKGETLHAADTFEWFAEEGKRSYGRIIPPTNVMKRHHAIKHPVGVVASITPWNFPVTLSRAQDRPGPGRRMHDRQPPGGPDASVVLIMIQRLIDAGLPPGVVNAVMGDARSIADAFFERPEVRKISFTGSTAVGKELIRRSATA